MPITIRPATEADRDVLESYMAGLQEFERRLHPSRRPGEDMARPHLRYLLELVEAHQGICLIGEQDGVPVGFLLGYVDQIGGHYLEEAYGTAGHVSDLYIEEDARGSGVLDALLAAAEAHFTALGLSQMTLSYVEGNDGAARAYDKRGFQPYERFLTKTMSAK
jgi:GNAT superfamily N-acetyltransferase